MIQIRKSEERGHADHGWLDARHTFSFADYRDPDHMGFRTLRVINEDVVAPGMGFGMHPHRDMEIVTYVLEGELEHKDSLGGHGVIRAGQLQRITAGSGVLHSEFNHSSTRPVHLYQIWLFPHTRGLEPGYEQYSPGSSAGSAPGSSAASVSGESHIRLIAAPPGDGGALAIHTDARIHLIDVAPGQPLTHELRPARAAWVQVVRGPVTLNGQTLHTSDGAAVTDEATLHFTADEAPAHLLLFDLP